MLSNGQKPLWFEILIALNSVVALVVTGKKHATFIAGNAGNVRTNSHRLNKPINVSFNHIALDLQLMI
ncbi:MAG: hypothetical protein KC546_16315 [Anaerolineae bacterium]|nr:hypothetical protein [Anaerolineae bacterium]